MSFWNTEKEYKVKLVNFTERFIKHNTLVKLYTQHYQRNFQGIKESYYTLRWKGMDWQITEGYINSNYFNVHEEVLPCPYSEANVVSVTSFGINGSFADEMSIVIEIPEFANQDDSHTHTKSIDRAQRQESYER